MIKVCPPVQKNDYAALPFSVNFSPIPSRFKTVAFFDFFRLFRPPGIHHLAKGKPAPFPHALPSSPRVVVRGPPKSEVLTVFCRGVLHCLQTQSGAFFQVRRSGSPSFPPLFLSLPPVTLQNLSSSLLARRGRSIQASLSDSQVGLSLKPEKV